MHSDHFLWWYNELSDPLFRHCYYRVYDRERAHDLVQDAFLRAWEYLERGQEIQNMKAFLYRLVNNLLIDESRKKKALSLDQLQAEGFDVASKPSVDPNIKLDAEAVLKIVKDLPDDYREVFILRYVNGLDPKEIADMLGETPNVVSVRLHRAVAKLRLSLNHGLST